MSANTETDKLGWVLMQGHFFLLSMASSVILTYVVVRTGGSIWPAIMVHAATNTWTKAVRGPQVGRRRTHSHGGAGSWPLALLHWLFR